MCPVPNPFRSWRFNLLDQMFNVKLAKAALTQQLGVGVRPNRQVLVIQADAGTTAVPSERVKTGLFHGKSFVISQNLAIYR
jgi:hypothetical protein